MKGQTNRKILEPHLQRRLRNAPTDAERYLWRFLRARQLDGAEFRRPHPFQSYVLDFVCLDRSVVVELDGGQHTTESDMERTRCLEQAGFTVLRFWNNEVFTNTDGVLEVIRENLVAGATPSPPDPPLEGEG